VTERSAPHVFEGAGLAEAQRLHREGRLDAASAAYCACLAKAEAAEALQGLGLIRFQSGDASGALPLLQAAHALAPDARSAFNLAAVLAQLGRAPEAKALHRDNLAERPDYVPSHFAFADLAEAEGDRQGAAAALAALAERAIPGGNADVLEQAVGRLAALGADPPNLSLLANRLRLAGRQDLTAALLEARLKRAPGDLGARLALAMARLAVVHASEDEIIERREAYAQDLARLTAVVEAAPVEALAEAGDEVGSAKPFILAYQGRCDRALQSAYGQAAARMMAARAPAPALGPAKGGRLRVGFATAYFHQHSVSKLFGGWIKRLDRGRFEVFGYDLGEAEDATSRELSQACDHIRRGPALDRAWAETIARDGLHALIYPEIGMHPLPVQLACRRLAPVQAMAWGHPVTSGFPDIDYFLSSDLMEPEDGERRYAERLVRLPNLSIWYEPLPSEGGLLTRSDLGLHADDVVFVCCQSLFKYLPRWDGVFPAIAKRVANARFLFIRDGREAVTRAFEARLSAAFREAGLEPERHIVLTPGVPQEAFPSLLRAGDLYLDSIGWSGGNTTLEAAACDLPVVTWPTELMRGRHTLAILTRMGVTETIADSADAYVDLAVSLADPKRRAKVAAKMAKGKARLYRDQSAVEALEDFLEKAAAEAGFSPPKTARAACA
jgi:predicted O-linked N-acetylglucosamine transferase (SPINDLY family)